MSRSRETPRQRKRRLKREQKLRARVRRVTNALLGVRPEPVASLPAQGFSFHEYVGMYDYSWKSLDDGMERESVLWEMLIRKQQAVQGRSFTLPVQVK